MIPAQFDYHAPTSVEDALQLLAELGDAGQDVKVLGGGQSLLPVLRLRLAAPEVVVDLGRIDSLRGVREDGDAIVIGAMTTHDTVTRDPLVRQHALLLATASETVADPQVRHRGTFGGALVHADPAGDLLAPALALDAELVIAGPSGRRTVPAAEFFQDYFTTSVQEGELLVEVRVPRYTGWGAAYEKFSRVAQAWSIVAVAAAVRVEGGTIAEARVGLTNMGSVPILARSVEQALVGRPATADAIRTAARSAGEGTSPPNDANGDEDYRRHLAGVLTGRAVLAAAGAS
jgi:aerobic carbon-monoxide dehydrogenase medium subunit